MEDGREASVGMENGRGSRTSVGGGGGAVGGCADV